MHPYPVGIGRIEVVAIGKVRARDLEECHDIRYIYDALRDQ